MYDIKFTNSSSFSYSFSSWKTNVLKAGFSVSFTCRTELTVRLLKSTLECTSNQAKNLPLTINLNSLILWQQFFRNICFLSKHRLRNVKKANRLKDFDLPREIVYVVIQIGLAIHCILRVEFSKWILFCDHWCQKQKRMLLRS